MQIICESPCFTRAITRCAATAAGAFCGLSFAGEREEWERDRGANHSIGQSRKEGNRGRMDGGGGTGDWVGYSTLAGPGLLCFAACIEGEGASGECAIVIMQLPASNPRWTEGRTDERASEDQRGVRTSLPSYPPPPLPVRAKECEERYAPCHCPRRGCCGFHSKLPPACEVGFCHLRPRLPQLPL